MKTTTQLARKFSELLVAELGAETIAEINKRNEAYAAKGDGACASHEFCDANDAMWEAFLAEMKREPNLHEYAGDDLGLMNSAWNLAKRNAFNAKAIL